MIEDAQQGDAGPEQLLQEYGHEPTPDEVAEEMQMPVERVQQIMKMAQQPISLPIPVGDGDDTSFAISSRTRVPTTVRHDGVLARCAEKIIDVLTRSSERERKVLSLRFGLVDVTAARSRRWANSSRSPASASAQIEAKALAQDAAPDTHPPALRDSSNPSRMDNPSAVHQEGRRLAPRRAGMRPDLPLYSTSPTDNLLHRMLHTFALVIAGSGRSESGKS